MMTSVARMPSGPNPRRPAATRSPDDGAASRSTDTLRAVLTSPSASRTRFARPSRHHRQLDQPGVGLALVVHRPYHECARRLRPPGEAPARRRLAYETPPYEPVDLAHAGARGGSQGDGLLAQ